MNYSARATRANSWLDGREALFCSFGNYDKQQLLREARRGGLAFAGTQHRGIDDARNIARLLPYCLCRLR